MTVYVLYHPSDVFVAVVLATDLKNLGLPVWLDRLEVDDQQDVFDETRKAEQASKVVLALLSPDLLNSGYGRSVIETAHTLHQPIVAVQLHHIPVDVWMMQLNPKRVVPLTQWLDAEAYRQALNQIVDELRRFDVPQETFVNPERRYIHRLMAKIQTHKALLEQNRYVVSHAFVPSDFDVETNWGLSGIFKARIASTMSDVRNLLRFVTEQKAVVLVGERGMGKTATMLRLLWEYLQDYRAGSSHVPLPFYVDLAAWEEGVPFATFVAQYVGFRPVLEDFPRGRSIAFVDHLEQMGGYSPARVEEVLAWLFDQKKQPLRVVLAAQHAAYKFPPTLPIVYLEKPLEKASVCLTAADMKEDEASAFIHELQQSPLWRAHATNASHFSMLTWYFLSYHQLPDMSPERLHLQYLHMLWTRKQVAEEADWVPFNVLLPSLARMAFLLIDEQLPRAFSRAQAARLLGSVPLIDVLTSASILLFEQTLYRFAKPFWLEILAAHHLQSLSLYECLTAPALDENGSWLRAKWDEVVVAYCGLVEDISTALSFIAEVNPLLAAACAYGRELAPQDGIYLTEKLIGYFREHPESLPAVRHSLDVLFAGAPLPALLSVMRQGTQVLRYAAASFALQALAPSSEHLETVLTNAQYRRSRQIAQQLHHAKDDALLVMMRWLSAQDAQQRAFAAWALGELADAAAVPLLLRALHDSTSEVRLAAIKALGCIGDAMTVDAIASCLLDTQLPVREAAAIALARMGASAVPPLLRMLQAPDNLKRRVAIGTLGQVGDVSLVDNIKPFLADANDDLRAIAVVALGDLRAEAEVDTLAYFLEDHAKPTWSKKTIAELAEQSLKKIDTKEARMRLNQRKRSSAQTALERLKGKMDECPLVPDDSSEELPLLNEDAEDTQAAPLVFPTAPIKPEDDSDMYRAETDDRLLRVLQELSAGAWADRDNAVRALRAYAELWRGSQNIDHVRPLLPYLRSKNSYVRWAVVEALAWIRNRAVMSYLLPLLRDPQWTVRVAAVEALAQIGNSLCVSYLLECLDDQHAKVREMVVIALASFRGEDGVLDALLRALRDRSEMVILTAVEALGNLGDRRAVPALLPFTQHENVVLRWAAVEALGKLRDETAVPYLKALLEDKSVLPWEEDGTMTMAHWAAQNLRLIESVTARHAFEQRQGD